MRIVLVAIGLVILLAVGWVLKGLMSDRDERDFAVHYSWIVKWALTLSRETEQAPAGASFDSPRIEVAGHQNRWVVSGNVNWRDALGNPVREPYTAIVENTCKAYADPGCWQLEGFALGEPAIDLAESARTGQAQTVVAQAPAQQPAQAAPGPAAQDEATGNATPAPAEAEQPAQPEPESAMAMLEEDSALALDGGALPAAPALPEAPGMPLPERKPIPPLEIGEQDVELALAEGSAGGEEDSVAAIGEAALSAGGEEDVAAALEDVGSPTSAVAQDADVATPDEPVEIASVGGSATVQPSVAASAPAPAAPAPASTPAEEPASAPAEETNVALLEPELPQPAAPAAALPAAPAAVAVIQPAPAQPAAPVPVPSSQSTPQVAPAAPSEPAQAQPVPLPEPEEEQIAALPPQAEPAPSPTRDPALVVLIQDRLDRAGYEPGPVDGRLGARTQAALREFERDAGLPVTGEPSRATLAALEQHLATRNAAAPQPQPKPQVAALPPAPARVAPPAPQPSASQPAVLAPAPAPAPARAPAAAPTTVRAPAEPTNLIQPEPGMAPPSADESLIFLIQHRLRQAGFSPGRFDGRMSDGTASAIRAYQARSGLPVDGVPSRALLDRLEADVLGNGRPQQAAPTPLG